jgi:hypothetical protein
MIAVTREDASLILHTPYELRDAVRDLPGRRWLGKQGRKVWALPATQEVAGALYDGLLRDREAQIDPPTLELIVAALDARKATAFKDAEDLPEIPGLRGESWEHQKQATWWAIVRLGGQAP